GRPAAVLSWRQDAAPATTRMHNRCGVARPGGGGRRPSDRVAVVSTRALTGILAPVTTPFGGDGAPDLDAFARNLRHYAATPLAGAGGVPAAEVADRGDGTRVDRRDHRRDEARRGGRRRRGDGADAVVLQGTDDAGGARRVLPRGRRRVAGAGDPLQRHRVHR